VLAQGDAIRRRDSAGVLEKLRDIQSEMAERHRLEAERDELLQRASTLLAVGADDVDIEVLAALGPAEEADTARAMSAELKGLFNEIERIHIENRVLVRQELAFLDHLMRAIAGTPQGGYTVSRATTTLQPTYATAFDLRA
jgi:hypothetical protein